jgi:hypothetical protein
LRAQAADQIAECAIGIATGLSDVGERTAIEEDGPQGFVTALLGVGGVQEEVPAKGIVHGPGS